MTPFSPFTKKIAEAIQIYDESSISTLIKNASNSERQALIQELLPHQATYHESSYFFKSNSHSKNHRYLDVDYEHSKQTRDTLCYTLAITVQSKNDLSYIENHASALMNLYIFSKAGIRALSDFYAQQLPDFICQFIDKNYHYYKKEKVLLNFITIFHLYQLGIIEYDESYFVNSLLAFDQTNHHSTLEFADFLLRTPEAMALIYKMTEYESKVLDLTKWTDKTGNWVCARTTNFWDEVFALMQAQGYVFDRAWLEKLLQSLTMNWKKPHLEWHCHLIQFLAPSTEELLNYQDILFANLASPHASIVKANIEWISQIYQQKNFHHAEYQANIIHSFVLEKSAKTLLKALTILEYGFDYSTPDSDYKQHIALLLMQSDMKLQAEVANLLIRHFNDATLADCLLPYQEYLHSKTQQIFAPILSPFLVIENMTEAVENPTTAPLIFNELHIPHEWHDILFMIGDCIHRPEAQNIEIFLAALAKLDNLPADIATQIKPYLKTLYRKADSATLIIFRAFLICLSEKRELKTDAQYKFSHREYTSILQMHEYQIPPEYLWQYYYHQYKNQLPFLVNICQAVLKRVLEQASYLPFLSTPSHAPFWIDANCLADRLLAYQAANQSPEIADLIVACNRLNRNSIDAQAQAKIALYTGEYQTALQYYFNLHDDIEPKQLSGKFLPLWAQISRLKHPDAVFPLFAHSKASDILSVIEPYIIQYALEYSEHTYEQKTYRHYNMRYCHNSIVQKKDLNRLNQVFTQLHFHANMADIQHAEDFAYYISLNPNYSNAFFCAHISAYAQFTEADDVKQATELMRIIIEYQLPIRHSGWLFIGACLLHEKKIVQSMAADYLENALMNGMATQDMQLLKNYIAYIIANKHIPINRLITFLDRIHHAIPILQFKLATLSLCLEHLVNTYLIKENTVLGNLPSGYKKLIAYTEEFATRLGIALDEQSLEQIKQLKKPAKKATQ